MSATKYQAIVFDLFGTLVDDLVLPEASRLVYDRMNAEVADTLGVPRDQFLVAWSGTRDRRDVGAFPSSEAALSHICRELGVEPGQERIRAAAEIRREFVGRALTPRGDAIDTLSELKASGYRVGLISNCSEEVSSLWPATPFARLMDASVLSCEVGLKKPDPRIYHLACQQLNVAPERSLFVGDGGNGELTGASRVGMHAVLIRAPYDQADGARESWPGPKVSSLSGVLSLLT